jgi:colanic acid/amylovoran biosynthesis glycosyltransferase
MRIAFFVDKFPVVSETFVLAQVAGMIRRGHDVTIFANSIVDPGASHPVIEQYSMMDKVIVRPAVREDWGGRALQGVRALGAAAKSGRILPALATLNVWRRGRAALGMHLAIRAEAHYQHYEFDILHCQFGQLGIEVAALKSCGVLEGRLLTSFRGADATIAAHQGSRKFDDLFQVGDCFLAVSESIRQELLRLGCPADKIEILRSGIDLTAFHYRGPRELHAPVRLVSIGRLAPTKGIEYALEAIRTLIDDGFSLRYLVVGDGPRRQELLEKTARLDLESVVEFHGRVGADRVVEILCDADILVAPSVVAPTGQTEGVPNVLKEAMACGVPAIGTRVGGVAELIEHGTNGFLVPQRDADAIANCIRTIVAQQDALPQILSRARQSIEEEYDLQRLNADLENVYERAVNPC